MYIVPKCFIYTHLPILNTVIINDNHGYHYIVAHKVIIKAEYAAIANRLAHFIYLSSSNKLIGAGTILPSLLLMDANGTHISYLMMEYNISN